MGILWLVDMIGHLLVFVAKLGNGEVFWPNGMRGLIYLRRNPLGIESIGEG